jgi:hypothetical protein
LTYNLLHLLWAEAVFLHERVQTADFAIVNPGQPEFFRWLSNENIRNPTISTD